MTHVCLQFSEEWRNMGEEEKEPFKRESKRLWDELRHDGWDEMRMRMNQTAAMGGTIGPPAPWCYTRKGETTTATRATRKGEKQRCGSAYILYCR